MPRVSASRRVILYGRTSIDQSEGRSVDDQLAVGRRWAESNGRVVVAELRDDGISASRYSNGKSRAGWETAMALIAGGKTDELWIWELSRSTRDRMVWAALLAALNQAAVTLVVDGKMHDPTDPDDGFVLDLSAALGVRESELISKRTRRAAASRAAAGRPHGAVPYGYRRVVDSASGETVGRAIHPVTGPVVQEIARRLLAGEAATAITTDLNRRGILTRSGQPWRSGNLSKMILRPVYAGLRIHQGEILPGVEGTWDALISEDDYRRLVALHADPIRDKFRKDTTVRHLGSGLFLCGREGCDGRMRVRVHARKPPEYACRLCNRLARRQAPVDQLVERLLIRRLAAPDVAEYLARLDSDPGAEEAAKELAMLRTELNAYIDDALARRIDHATLLRIEPRMRKRIEVAEQRARSTTLPGAVHDMAGPDAAENWAAASIGDRRTVLDALLTITIMPAGRSAQKFDPSLIRLDWRGPHRD